MKTIKKGSFGFAEGFTLNMPKYKGGTRQLDFALIKNYIEENKDTIQSVEAGLAEDWGYTSGNIYTKENEYTNQDDTYVYGASNWATPSIEICFIDGSKEMFESWKLGSDSSDWFEGAEKDAD